MEPSGRAGGPVKKSTTQLGIGPELYAKRKKQEGEHASDRTCTLQRVLGPWTRQLLTLD